MKLRDYQEKAVEKIITNIEKHKKICIKIPVGLGRTAIIITVASKCISEGMKVLILTPQKSMSYQLIEMWDKELERESGDTLLRQYKEIQHLLITTYNDLQAEDETGEYDLIIFDGIHFNNKYFVEKYAKDKVCIVGFTSQVSGELTGFFHDSKCVFQYTLQEAFEKGYVIEGYQFEKIVFDIFKNQGYEVSLSDSARGAGYDLIAKTENECLAVEIKRWSSRQIGTNILLKTVKKLEDDASRDRMRPVLVTNTVISEEQREKVNSNGNVTIVDVQNLLYMAQSNVELENKLRRFLNYTTDDIILLGSNLKLQPGNDIKKVDIIEEFIQAFLHWEASNSKFTEYEELCYEALKYLFEDELTLWERQKNSNENLFRFDLICKIKGDYISSKHQKDFWEMAEKFFNTKYIIFEFKNYKEEITQKEIYTTEKYLYLKVLRGIAIIISPSGIDISAEKAISGILREQGKLILSLSNRDMREMLEKKKNNEDATSCLSDKLDKLLINLGK